MRLDDLISRTNKELEKTRDPQKRLVLSHHLNTYQKTVAIRVRTRPEADDMLDLFKRELLNFPYPFGPYLTWIEIEDLTYMVMPPDETWPHWQIYLGVDIEPGMRKGEFLWSADGRIGPHRDQPGGQEIGPTIYTYQEGYRCAGCEYFGVAEDDNLVHKMVVMDKRVPPLLAQAAGGLACRFSGGPDPLRCKHSIDFWGAALLPVSIILYISLAPTRELDRSWQPPRQLGKGKSLRTKAGHYLLTPIKKTYIRRRIEHYRIGTTRNIEIPYFVRGHKRRAHKRFLPWRGEYTDVKESWVKEHWRAGEWEELPPHYILAWGKDPRVEGGRRLQEE